MLPAAAFFHWIKVRVSATRRPVPGADVLRQDGKVERSCSRTEVEIRERTQKCLDPKFGLNPSGLSQGGAIPAATARLANSL